VAVFFFYLIISYGRYYEQGQVLYGSMTTPSACALCPTGTFMLGRKKEGRRYEDYVSSIPFSVTVKTASPSGR